MVVLTSCHRVSFRTWLVVATLAAFTATAAAAEVKTNPYPDIRVEVGPKVSNVKINALGAKPTLLAMTGNEPSRIVPLKSQDLRSIARLTAKLKDSKPQDVKSCKRQFVQLTFETGNVLTYCLETQNSAGIAARTLVRRLDLALKVRSRSFKAKRSSVPTPAKKSTHKSKSTNHSKAKKSTP